MKKKVITIVTIILVISTAVFLYFKYGSKGSGEKKSKDNNFNNLISQLEGIVAQPITLEQEIEVSGTVMPFEETTLVSEVSGKVVKINFDEGKSVQSGTLLVKLFDEDLQAQLKMLETQLKIAENTEKRMKSLLNINGASQQEYDASYLQINNIKAQIDIVKVNIGKTEIRAPFNGTIGLKRISPGQYVTPATLIATLRSINSLKLDFSIPEKYSASIKTGTKVKFNVTGNDKTYEASVIANEAEIERESRNLNVRTLVSGDIKGLLPGAFAKVKVNLGDRINAVMIPTGAIIPVNDEKRVFISKNGIAQQVSIKTGIRKADNIEVISGINPGDTVVTTGVLFIKQNSQLKFSSVK